MLLNSGLFLSPVPDEWSNVVTNKLTHEIFATPDEFNAVPFFDGIGWAMAEPGQMRLDLVGAHAKDKIYNIGVFRDPLTGLPMIGTTPEWVSSILDGPAAHFGAHPANWLPVNQQETLMRNGDRTVVVSAHEAYWLGTYFASNVGIVIMDVENGPGPRHLGLWNRWNRKSVKISVSDPGPTSNSERSFSYDQRHPDYVNANPNNHFIVVTGMPSQVRATYHHVGYGAAGAIMETAIQFDDETFSTGQLPQTFPGQTKPGALKHSGNITSLGRTDAHTVKAEATKVSAMGLTKAAAIWWVESFSGGGPSDTRAVAPPQAALGWGSIHSTELAGWLDA